MLSRVNIPRLILSDFHLERIHLIQVLAVIQYFSDRPLLTLLAPLSCHNWYKRFYKTYIKTIVALHWLALWFPLKQYRSLITESVFLCRSVY